MDTLSETQYISVEEQLIADLLSSEQQQQEQRPREQQRQEFSNKQWENSTELWKEEQELSLALWGEQEIPSSPSSEEISLQQLATFCIPESPVYETSGTFDYENAVEVSLLQKKRGSGGVWQLVTQQERIRVDKNKGKIIKLQIRSRHEALKITDRSLDINLFLVDLAHPEPPAREGEGFVVVPLRNRSEADTIFREFKLKLTKICKSQVFSIAVRSPNGCSFMGSSTEFRSDDNGKVQSLCRKRKKSETIAPIPTASPVLSSGFDVNNSQIYEAIREGLVRYSPQGLCLANNPDFFNLIANSLVPALLNNFQLQINAMAQNCQGDLKRQKVIIPSTNNFNGSSETLSAPISMINNSASALLSVKCETV